MFTLKTSLERITLQANQAGEEEDNESHARKYCLCFMNMTHVKLSAFISKYYG